MDAAPWPSHHPLDTMRPMHVGRRRPWPWWLKPLALIAFVASTYLILWTWSQSVYVAERKAWQVAGIPLSVPRPTEESLATAFAYQCVVSWCQGHSKEISANKPPAASNPVFCRELIDEISSEWAQRGLKPCRPLPVLMPDQAPSPAQRALLGWELGGPDSLREVLVSFGRASAGNGDGDEGLAASQCLFRMGRGRTVSTRSFDPRISMVGYLAAADFDSGAESLINLLQSLESTEFS